MRIISRKALSDFWTKHTDAEGWLRAWYDTVAKASWVGPQDIKNAYASASFVGERVVFNVKGNEYRLVVWVNYEFHTVYVRFLGTHDEYDRIDVTSI